MNLVTVVLLLFYVTYCSSSYLRDGVGLNDDGSHGSEGTENVEELYPEPEFLMKVESEDYLEEVGMAFRLRRCTPTLCCPMNLKCGPNFFCSDHDRVVQTMENCFKTE